MGNKEKKGFRGSLKEWARRNEWKMEEAMDNVEEGEVFCSQVCVYMGPPVR